jgi:uncharacterized protein
MKKIINLLCLGLGLISFGLGLLGVILPILPTTPFILLAAVLFAKSSDRSHKWLLSTRIYKDYVGKWMTKKSMTGKEKIKVLCLVTILLGISIYFAPIWHVKVFILAILIGHYYFLIFRMKTTKDKSAEVSISEVDKCGDKEELGV